MKKKNHPPQFRKNRWIHLGFALGLAFSLALVLLLIPITAGTVIQFSMPIPSQSDSGQSQTIDLSLPFGVSRVYATNGLTLTKTAPATVDQGTVLTYILRATNETGYDLIDAKITDTTPAGATCYDLLKPPALVNPYWTINPDACRATGLAEWDMLYYPQNPSPPPTIPPYLTISFTNKTTNVFTYSILVDQPLPDQFELINSSYTISATDGTSTFNHDGTPVTTKVNAPNWAITKTVSSQTIQPGERLTYTITLSNVGHLASSGPYTITDSGPANTTFAGASPPETDFDGSTITWVLTDPVEPDGAISLSFAVTVTDILTDGEKIVNQNYQVSGGNVYTPTTAGRPITVTVESSATLVITKTARPDPVQAGDWLTYTITITNDAASKSPALGVIISDTLPAELFDQTAGFVGAVSGVVTDTGNPVWWTLNDPIPVGDSVQVTVTARVTSPRLPGLITNTFAANADNAAFISGTLTSEISATNIITLNKTVDPVAVAPGDTVTYTVTLTNSGNSIAAIDLADRLHPYFRPASYTKLGITLPGRTPFTTEGVTTEIFTATAPITPGIYANRVVTATYDLTRTTIGNVAPVQVVSAILSLAKEADPSPAKIGDTITYTYTVTNDGDTPLSDLILTDDPLGPISLGSLNLDPTESTTGTASLLVTEAHLPGPLTNTATVTGTYLSTNQVITTTMESVNLVYTTAVTVNKHYITSNGLPAGVGDTITYTYDITNTGTVTLYVIIRNDDKLGLTFVTPPPLAPEKSTSVTDTTVVQESDLLPDLELTNVVTITGINILPESSVATNTATVPLTYTAAITVDKSYTASDGLPAKIGDTITYTYRLTNTGSVTLYTVSLVDDKLGSMPVAPLPLEPKGERVVVTSTVITEADLPELTNLITVTGANNSLAETVVATDTATVPLISTTDITLTKQYDISSGVLPGQIGDTILYTYTFTNTGNVTLDLIELYDDKLELLLFSAVPLAPEESDLVTQTVVIDESHMPGPLTNIATVTGTNRFSDTAVATATVTIPLTFTVDVSLEKTVAPTTATLGAGVVYTYRLTNEGDLSLDTIDLVDDRLDPISVPGLPLAPGDFTDAVANYTITYADLINHYPTLTNTAVATAANTAVSRTDTATDTAQVNLVYSRNLDFDKTANVSVAKPGDTITYTYTITNTGNLTLTIVGDLFDDRLDNVTPASAVLPPNGGSTTGTATYTVLVGDVPAITNTAFVTAEDGILSEPLTDTDTVTVQIQEVLTVITATNSSPDQVFNTINFTATTNLDSGVTYTWDFDDGSTPVTVPVTTTTHTYTSVGVYTATVAASNGVSTITGTTVVTITPGPPDHLELVPDGFTQTAGVPFTITITAVDQYGNTITDLTGPVNVSDDTGTIVPTLVTLVNGVTTTTFIVTQATAPLPDTITATTGTITGTVDVVIEPNVPFTLTVTVDPTTLRVCQTAAVTTTLTDQWGNPTPGEPVSLQVLPGPTGNATLSPPSGSTNGAGIFISTLQATEVGTVRVFGESGSVNNLLNLPVVTLFDPPVPSAITVTVTPDTVLTGGTATAQAEVGSCVGPVNGQPVTFTVGSLATIIGPGTATTNAGGVATTTVRGDIAGVTTITGTVAGPLVDTTPFTITTPVTPELTIAKTATPPGGNVEPGQIISYEIVVSNIGSGPAANVVITDDLDADVTFAGGSITPPGSGPFPGTGLVTFTVSSLAAGSSVTATLDVTVTTSLSGTDIINTASANSDDTDPVTIQSPVTHRVVTPEPSILYLPLIMKEYSLAPDLIADFSLEPPNPAVGEPVVITVVITNVGNAPTGDGFWVDFYMNPVPAPTTGNQRWDLLDSDVSPKQGIAWVVPAPGLAAGASMTLTSSDAGGLPPSDPHTIWSGSFVNGTQHLYVYVDSFSTDGLPSAGILERDETNNRAEYHFLTPLSGGPPLTPGSLPDPTQLPPRWDP